MFNNLLKLSFTFSPVIIIVILLLYASSTSDLTCCDITFSPTGESAKPSTNLSASLSAPAKTMKDLPVSLVLSLIILKVSNGEYLSSSFISI